MPFERINRLAARLFGVPSAFVALAGPGQTAFAAWLASACAAALPPDGVLVLEDARDDPRHPGHLDGAAGLRIGFLAAAPLIAPDGSRFGALCLADSAARSFDTTERALLRDLAALAEDAWGVRTAGERRHQTFTLAAHELRTPLASILGFSELLVKRDVDPADARELHGIIHAQAERMSKVANQVFDLARIEAGGRAALRIAPTPVEAVLVQALGSVAALGQNARIQLEIAPGLAPVAADPYRLALALANVLENSIRYSKPGTPVTVSASALPGPAAPAVLLRVRDEGAGMTPEQQARLFESFYRGPAPPDAGGAGLGMAIFKEIMDLHQAGVEIASAPGAGTVLSIRLPAAETATEATGA